jgi:hypothetical protein
MHGFLLLALVLVLVSTLNWGDGAGALPAAANITGLLAGLAVVIIEMVARDAFFGLRRKGGEAPVVVFVVATAAIWARALWRLSSEPVRSGGGPTEAGWLLADAIIMTTIPVALAIKAAVDRRGRGRQANGD